MGQVLREALLKDHIRVACNTVLVPARQVANGRLGNRTGGLDDPYL